VGFFADGVSKPGSDAFMHDSITRQMAYFLCRICMDEKFLLIYSWSGGHANILNKQHNSSDCFEPPGHLCFVMVVFVLYARKNDAKKGNKFIKESKQ